MIRTTKNILIGMVLVWAMAQSGLFSGRPLVNAGGWSQIADFWQAATQPDLSFRFLRITFESALVTLAYAVSGTFLSLLIGISFGLFASEVWWRSFHSQNHVQNYCYQSAWLIIRVLLAIPRGIHELIWGLFFLNIFGLDPIVAILAIGIPFGATVAKVFAELLDEAPQEPYLALLNSGAPPLKAMVYGLIPAALPDMISYAFYRFECAIRAAAVLGVVGAGGLGYQILLSMQTLNYNETWTLFYALILLSGGADAWSAQIRQRLGRSDVACQEVGHAPNNGAGTVPNFDRFLRGSLWAAGLLIPISFWFANPTISLLWAERSQLLLADIADRAWPLRLTLEDGFRLVDLSQLTLAMSILAAVLAGTGGALLSFLAARTFFEPGGVLYVEGENRLWLMTQPILRQVVRSLLLLMRAIPAPIWALMLLFVLFPGVLPGAVALAIYNMGVLGRLMAEVAENQDKRPAEAIRGTGASSGSVFLYCIVPAVAPRYTAYSLYRWENTIRETVIVGVVGAGGLGREMAQQLSAFNYRGVLALLICTVILTFGVDLISSQVRNRLR